MFDTRAGTKRCGACKAELPLAAFNIDKARKDGLNSRCRVCRNIEQQQRYQKHKPISLQRTREYRKAHPEVVKAIQRRYSQGNRGKINANGRTYGARRRARKRAVLVGQVNYKTIRARDRMRCHVCKRKVRETDLHFDHVIPLAKGGPHIESNIAVAHAMCNLRKHANVLTLF